MTSFSTPTRFDFIYKKINFCSHIAERANIAEFANIAKIFCHKFFGDIGPPCIYFREFKVYFNLASSPGIGFFRSTYLLSNPLFQEGTSVLSFSVLVFDVFCIWHISDNFNIIVNENLKIVLYSKSEYFKAGTI